MDDLKDIYDKACFEDCSFSNYKNFFAEKTLHLLQFTRSAIFNYVFLIRNEARKNKSKIASILDIL